MITSNEPVSTTTMATKKNKPVRFVDLCCGIGGFRIAIQRFAERKQRRFECVYSADVKRDAIKAYNAQFGESMGPRDVMELGEEMPGFDLLLCGFPCQPFSSAGAKRGFDDARGGLIFKIRDLCRMHEPATVILENVANLIRMNHGQDLRRICDMFQAIGYTVRYKRLNSRDFGVPQSRERVYIVMTRTEDKRAVDLDTIGQRSNRTIADVIESSAQYTDVPQDFADKLLALHRTLPVFGKKIQDKRGGPRNIHSWDLELNGRVSPEEKRLMKRLMTERRKKKWCQQKGIVWMDGIPLTKQDIASFFETDQDLDAMLANLVRLDHLKMEKPKDLVDGKRVYKESAETGYNICKGKLSFPVSKILDPAGVAPTLTATDASRLVVMVEGKHIRCLTRLELKRICGFPDDYRLPEDVNAFDLFGNMVTPPVVEALLEVVYD